MCKSVCVHERCYKLLLFVCSQEVVLLWTCIILHVHHALLSGESLNCSELLLLFILLLCGGIITMSAHNSVPFSSFTSSPVSLGTELVCCARWPSSPSSWCLSTLACLASPTTSITPPMSWLVSYREPWWPTPLWVSHVKICVQMFFKKHKF